MRLDFQLLLMPFLALAIHVMPAQSVVVDIDQGKVLNHFDPQQTLGSSIDRISTEAVDKGLSKRILDQVAPSGGGPITYRNNTELAVEAWHWNPQGSWSGPGKQGYFVGSPELGKPIDQSYGYTLPRRGFTRNDGTGNTGYSRLTDGDTTTFWKSNPYLTKVYTGEDDAKHPQWIIIDLKHVEAVDTIRIAWAAPFARHYALQYWTGPNPARKSHAGSMGRCFRRAKSAKAREALRHSNSVRSP